MLLFDTYVQKLKYKVLKEVARHDYAGTLQDCYLDIPKVISPGPRSTMRCCIYKERAIVGRAREDRHGRRQGKPQRDRGHRHRLRRVPRQRLPGRPRAAAAASRTAAPDACPRGAISFDDTITPIIDPDKCVNCGNCASVCPYSAIHKPRAPLRARVQGQGHLSMAKTHVASHRRQQMHRLRRVRVSVPLRRHSRTRAYLLDAIHIIRDSENNQKYKVYAVVAPSISSQFVVCQAGAGNHGPQAAGLLPASWRRRWARTWSPTARPRSWPRRASSPPAAAPPSSATLKRASPRSGPSSATTSPPWPSVATLHQGHRPGRQNHLHRPLHGQEGRSSSARSVRPWIDCVHHLRGAAGAGLTARISTCHPSARTCWTTPATSAASSPAAAA